MWARVSVSGRTSQTPHTSVWKSPSDESGVLAEEESQFLLCSSIRSFCSPGTMDSSGVMFLKLSQELWSSGFDLSLMEKEGKENSCIRCSPLLMRNVTWMLHKRGSFRWCTKCPRSGVLKPSPLSSRVFSPLDSTRVGAQELVGHKTRVLSGSGFRHLCSRLRSLFLTSVAQI